MSRLEGPPYDGSREDGVSEAFDRGLVAVQNIQRAHFIVTRQPVTVVSQENLVPLIPMAIRDVANDPEGWPQSLELFGPNLNVHEWTRGPDLTVEN